jgi:hypothetical protein
MNTVKCKTFKAEVTIGLYKNYTSELISRDEFDKALLVAQEVIKNDLDVYLSTKISECQIVFLGQNEPSIELQFIQYPKFLVEELELKNAIVELVKLLMKKLQQNRIVIVFPDETIMLEETSDIDDSIKL